MRFIRIAEELQKEGLERKGERVQKEGAKCNGYLKEGANKINRQARNDYVIKSGVLTFLFTIIYRYNYLTVTEVIFVDLVRLIHF